MKIQPLGLLYHALYILQGPFSKYVNTRLRDQPKWFEQMQKEHRGEVKFFRKDDISTSIGAMIDYWSAFESTFTQKNITTSNLKKLRGIRNKIAHISEDELKHSERVWAFDFIHKLLDAIGEQEAAEDLLSLHKGFERGVYMSPRHGEYCRKDGKKLKHHERPCEPLHHVDREKKRVGEYCEVCGEKCEIEEDIVYAAKCQNQSCAAHE